MPHLGSTTTLIEAILSTTQHRPTVEDPTCQILIRSNLPESLNSVAATRCRNVLDQRLLGDIFLRTTITQTVPHSYDATLSCNVRTTVCHDPFTDSFPSEIPILSQDVPAQTATGLRRTIFEGTSSQFTFSPTVTHAKPHRCFRSGLLNHTLGPSLYNPTSKTLSSKILEVATGHRLAPKALGLTATR